jgi:hypothetical protein
MNIRRFVSENNITGSLSVRIMNVESPDHFSSFSAGYRWVPGWNIAACAYREFSFRKHPEKVPVEWCRCGFYGLTRNYDQIASWRTLASTAVVLAEARGKVILHENGLRAEKMRVVASVELSWSERFWNHQIGNSADGWKWARDYFGVPLVSAKWIAPLVQYQMDRQ